MIDAALPRLLAALLCLGLLLLAERRWPFRALPRGRWWPNLGLASLNAGLLALLPALSALFAAHWAARHRLGLLHWLALPDWLALPLAFLAMDAAVYAQHRAMHHWPLLWRLHRVHHADPALDVTSGLRFHPAEALVSALYKAAVTVLLGAPLAAVLAFVLALNLGALFSHANLRLSGKAERRLRRLLVTPGMHRIHHSQRRQEQDRNFGFFSPWWDRLFGSYQAAPLGGEATLRIGLDSGPERPAGLAELLRQPLRPDPAPPASDTMLGQCKTPPDSKP
ncbi:sterol desaturase family protein [Stagnimonas aquatica]|uniref:Sterol desaturase family protein n=1 Tax=Stagnimonas aquatica TaxID=2689987 RepID=A0A3N0V1L8_9GAMM|nr:sterol desaturase family protein [Stagnimonas aquatica]ROH86679.1 sterol desaturase family protein [Stagnimonas aquatica]